MMDMGGVAAKYMQELKLHDNSSELASAHTLYCSPVHG